MTIETKELVISEELKRKVEMICRFAYVDCEFINGKRTKHPTYYENVVDPIVSKEKWENCQYQKQRNARHYERTATYLFTNKLKCANCGKFLGGCATTKKKSGKKYYYYKCEQL